MTLPGMSPGSVFFSPIGKNMLARFHKECYNALIGKERACE